MHDQLAEIKERFAPGWLKWIDVGEGWYQLVIDCHNELLAIDPTYQIEQIKEKYGGLRYYCSPGNSLDVDSRQAMEDVIRKYEELSFKTCEATGRPGVLMKSAGGWLKTLDPEYAEDHYHHARYTVVRAES
jgi:hypothetical protein